MSNKSEDMSKPMAARLNQTPARAKFVGVGNAGCNVLDYLVMNMIDELELCAINTDTFGLKACLAPEKAKLQVGRTVTYGLSSGGDPDIGETSAVQSEAEILQLLGNAEVVFLTAGLGGGTGSGATRVIAELAKRQGMTVIALVTMPFSFEGSRRREQALVALAGLRQSCNAVFTFPFDRMLGWMESGGSVFDAFNLGYELIAQCARGLRQIMTRRGLIPLDPEDIFRVLDSGELGPEWDCWFAWGCGDGEGRMDRCLKQVAEAPLFGTTESRAQAHDVLVTITGGQNLTLAEVHYATHFIRSQFDPSANVLLGANIDESYGSRVHVMVLASRPDQRIQPPEFRPANGTKHVAPAMPFASPIFQAAAGIPFTGHAQGHDFQSLAMDESFTEAETSYIGVPERRAQPDSVADGIIDLGAEDGADEAGVQARPGTQRVKGAPDLTPEERRKRDAKQESFAFEEPNRGRFEKTEATMYKGENLDLPTYLRRGMKVKSASPSE